MRRVRSGRPLGTRKTPVGRRKLEGAASRCRNTSYDTFSVEFGAPHQAGFVNYVGMSSMHRAFGPPHRGRAAKFGSFVRGCAHMAASVHLTSRIDPQHRAALENLLFFNSSQHRVLDGIKYSIERYGAPELVEREGSL